MPDSDLRPVTETKVEECERLHKEVRERDTRIATLEAALIEARKWLPEPPGGLLIPRARRLSAASTLRLIDAALVGDGS